MHQLLQEYLRPLLRDLHVYRLSSVIAFVAILALFTVAGVFWPGRYSSSVTVFVEQRDILGPLMEGAAVQTDVRDEAGLARELIYGRKILEAVATEFQLISSASTPAAIDETFESIRDRTSIDPVGDNLIQIEYWDTDPVRTHGITRMFADLFIAESTLSKLSESKAAFEFIDKRVGEYAVRLEEVSDQIKIFRAENQTVAPGAEDEIRERIQELSIQIENQQQQIREAEVKAASLRSQLSGEREAAVVATEADQIQQRISALQTRLDTLRLSYHDKYPDIVALREQIADLERQAEEADYVVQRSGSVPQGGDDANPPQSVINVVGQQLRQELYNTDTLIATLKARLEDTRRMLENERERVRRIPEVEATLAELNRDLDVNLTLYNDLVRRREYARVSMNVDQENQGLTLTINEPANFPTTTSGPRLAHFVALGLMMAFGVPPAFLLAMQQMDMRVRDNLKLESIDLVLPVFVDIPHLATPGEARGVRAGYAMLAATVVLGIGGALGVGVLRLLGYL
jgi:polysaccharide chain length determinant protein (PEP-CTERM system associated)